MLTVSKLKVIIFFTISFSLLTASSPGQVIASKGARTGYYTAFSESYFGYVFYPDNFCVSVTLGHFGNSKVYNRYNLQHDTILITPLPAKFQTLDYSAWKRDTLIFKNDSCLFNIREKWEYCLLYDTMARKGASLR